MLRTAPFFVLLSALIACDGGGDPEETGLAADSGTDDSGDTTDTDSDDTEANDSDSDTNDSDDSDTSDSDDTDTSHTDSDSDDSDSDDSDSDDSDSHDTDTDTDTDACTANHASVGTSATLTTYHHGVTGTATIVDDCHLRIDAFSYDGKGLDVRVYGGVDGDYDNGFPMTDDLLKSGGYTNVSIEATLPTGKTWDDLNGISLWCVDASIDFGSTTIAP